MSDKKDDIPWSSLTQEPKGQNVSDKTDDIPWGSSPHEPKEENVSDKKDDVPWSSSTHKQKEQNISEIMQKSRADASGGSARVDLKQLLVQRTMARHGFTEDQALALIHAFGG